MTRGRARRYLLVKQGYYPQVVADAGYTVFDWDASRLSTLYQDSAKTTPVAANSDPVGAWVDGVGGVDAVQATTANKPTYTTSSLNGLPTLAFDGGDLLATANISISTFAVWVVFRTTVVAGRVVYEHSANVTANPGALLLSRDNPDSIYVNRGALLSSKQSSPVTDGVWRVVRHVHQGTNASHMEYANNVSVVTGAGENSNDVGTGTATASLNIGARSSGTLNLTGNIGQLLIMSPYPTDAEIIANMESYINGIWGVY